MHGCSSATAITFGQPQWIWVGNNEIPHMYHVHIIEATCFERSSIVWERNTIDIKDGHTSSTMEVKAEIVEKHEGGWYYVILIFQQWIEAGGCI